MNASRRGNYRRQEGATLIEGHVALAIFEDLVLSLVQMLGVKVLMAQGCIHRGIINAALEVMNEGSVSDEPTKGSHERIVNVHVPHDETLTNGN